MTKRNSYMICHSEDGTKTYALIKYFIALHTVTFAVASLLDLISNYCYPSQLTILHSRVIPVTLQDNTCDISLLLFINDLQGCVFVPYELYTD